MKIEIRNSVKAQMNGLVSRGIKACEVDANGHLIFTLTDNSTADMGLVWNLNGVESTAAEIADAVEKKHSHDNKAALDTVPSGGVVTTLGADDTTVPTSKAVREAIVDSVSGVSSFNNRTGAVNPARGDYTAEMVGAEPSGAVEAHDEDADAHSALLAGKADKSSAVNATLLASSWVGTEPPYTCTLSVAGVTATSNQEILPALTITQEQLEAMQGANIVDGGQAAGEITLKAWGDVPEIDIPIRVVKRGDM